MFPTRSCPTSAAILPLNTSPTSTGPAAVTRSASASTSKQDLNHKQAEFAGQNHGAQGGFNFNGGPTQISGGPSSTQYNVWAAFLLGAPANYGTTYQVDDEYATRTNYFSSFIQNTWQVNQKLTVNIGTRYENIPMPTRGDRGMERYDFKTNNMLVCGVGSVPKASPTVRMTRRSSAPASESTGIRSI